MVPPAMTRAVSSVVAKNVAKLIVAFSSGAQLRWPARASRSAPRRGTPRTSAISTLVLLELFHMPDVEAVEALADMEEKYSEYEGADQHVERHAQLDHERHAVGGAGGGEEETVLHGQKTDDLRHRFLAHDHHEEGKQHAREGDPQRRARERGRHLRNRGGQGEGEYHQADPDQHGRRNVDEGLDVPAHEQAVDQTVQHPGEDRKSTRLNSSHGYISYAVFCLKKKKKIQMQMRDCRRGTSCTTYSRTSSVS